MKIQQENICEYPKIREIREHFLSWTIPVIRYIHLIHFPGLQWTTSWILLLNCQPKILNCSFTILQTFYQLARIDYRFTAVLKLVMMFVPNWLSIVIQNGQHTSQKDHLADIGNSMVSYHWVIICCCMALELLYLTRWSMLPYKRYIRDTEGSRDANCEQILQFGGLVFPWHLRIHQILSRLPAVSNIT